MNTMNLSHLPEAPQSAVVDSWYGDALKNASVEPLEEQLLARFPASLVKLARKLSVLRGLLWYAVAHGKERVVSTFSARGLFYFLALEWFSGRRGRVYLVEFLRPEPSSWKQRIKDRVHQAVCRTLFPRTLGGAQVMTLWERDAYAEKYRLPRERFNFIPFPMMLKPAELPPELPQRSRIVMSSGRAACDWASLFAAAQGTDWQLVIVCSKADKAQVDILNSNGRATVLCEISADEHQRLLMNAAVYALVLKEQRVSSGQVRLARAIEAGVPVVASKVQGLEGYLEDQVTGFAVAHADPVAIRNAVNLLLDDAARHRQLRHAAYEAMRARSLDAYLLEIRRFALA